MNDAASPVDPTSPAPVSRLAAVRAAYASLQPRVIAGGPWPLSDDIGTGPEASWGPPEVLAHVAEALPFWLGEYERVVEAGRGPGDGVPFGRTADDGLRVGIIERDRTVPLRDLFDRIDASIERWLRRLAAGGPAEAIAVGRHSRLGEMTAAEISDRFAATHLEEHARQLEEIVGRG